MGHPSRSSIALLLLCVALPSVRAIRWLGIQVNEDSTWNRTNCHKGNGFAGRQYSICRNNLEVMRFVSEAVALTRDECKVQMADRRWNCSSVEKAPSFMNDLKRGTKESAFVYALSSAALTYSVTQACSISRLPGICGCGSQPKLKLENESWLWGGCNDNIEYGARFSKKFTDAVETKRMKKVQSADRALMNLHNNEAGRRLVRNEMETVCRCHGASGSCQTQTCSRRLPLSFIPIAETLKKRLSRTVTVVSKKRGKNSQQLRPKRGGTKLSNDEMVSLDPSPNYCVADLNKGSYGTKGRECNPNTRGKGSCSYMCCGRGTRTFKRTTEERCNCRYIWCCYVKCQTCVKTEDITVCL